MAAGVSTFLPVEKPPVEGRGHPWPPPRGQERWTHPWDRPCLPPWLPQPPWASRSSPVKWAESCLPLHGVMRGAGREGGSWGKGFGPAVGLELGPHTSPPMTNCCGPHERQAGWSLRPRAGPPVPRPEQSPYSHLPPLESRGSFWREKTPACHSEPARGQCRLFVGGWPKSQPGLVESRVDICLQSVWVPWGAHCLPPTPSQRQGSGDGGRRGLGPGAWGCSGAWAGGSLGKFCQGEPESRGIWRGGLQPPAQPPGVLLVPGRASSPHPSSQKGLPASLPISLAPAHSPTVRPVPAHAVAWAHKAAFSLELPRGCPSPPCAFSCLPCTSLGSPQPPGPPVTPWVKPGPQAPAASPQQGSPLPSFPRGPGTQVRLGR